ncbi:RNA polymerase factor sigma-54 [Blattabacterium cuenoti]|uniref:RNA polymerase factor sigma-54 n=1 Tax=Blattabacterium cuenoti TaxID=1653831 RepID=UPI00163CAF6D|nr:RNA polymerase factor sigma-54 [Blattabacterium cuenoti]
MLKHKLIQKVHHRLSPQQIKLLKLVQLSTLDFEKRVQQELEENPALEEEHFSIYESEEDNVIDFESLKNENKYDENNSYETYDNLNEEEYESFNKENLYVTNNNKNSIIYKNITVTYNTSFQEYLRNQLHTFRFLNKEDLYIADFILGNIDDNGYIRRTTKSMADDIMLIFGKSIKEEKIEQLLIEYIQKLDPIGIGSRNLQECLFIQLNRERKSEDIFIAEKIISNYFEYLVKKNYHKLQKKLGVTKKKLKKAICKIKKLNPKPGKIFSENYKNFHNIIPDFTISILDEKLELSINHRNTPELIVSPSYVKMLKKYYKFSNKENQEKHEKTFYFIKSKINSAKWFVDAIKQRKNTLLLTMNAIMDYQKEYFLTGDPIKIKPMILKNISQKIGIGISTVSRVANRKYVNTPYGTFLIKSFFSEKMKNKEGDEISSIKIKKYLKEFISQENKKKPLTDEKLSNIFKKKGYIIARRTITKYRSKMNIPISKMRKTL